jgi:hypothetical protein
VRDFLADARLPMGDRDEILAAMKDVQANGLEVARHLQGEVHEVRADGRQATYRVLFATEGAGVRFSLPCLRSRRRPRRRRLARSPWQSDGYATGGLALHHSEEGRNSDMS